MKNTSTTCKHCTKEVAPNAKRCPHCHGDLRNWFARHKVMTGILVLILIIVGLSSLGSGEAENVSNDTNSNQQSASEEDPIVISAIRLSQEYDDNKVAADAKYKDKIVQMTGVIDDIGKDITDTPYVTLEGTQNVFFGIQCMFSRSDEPVLAELSRGQSITLQGRVSGEIIGDVIVRGCSIVK